MRPIRLWVLKISFVFIFGYIQTTNSFVVVSQKASSGAHNLVAFTSRSRCRRGATSVTKHAALRQGSEDGEIFGDSSDGYDERNYYSLSNNSNYDDKNGEDSNNEKWVGDQNPNESAPPTASQNPDRAISIVSELKANAALFAAFAYGSLNLPNTLTVSESKVTSVTTSLSISRPLPDSDLIRAFVVLDVSTLCLMISCVAASQLLIYRLTDGSYEDVDENYGDAYNSPTNLADNFNGCKRRKNSRESALGRLVTTYRNEFTVARITFDLGLVTLLFSVGIRSLAIFDEDIVLPITIIISITAVFLAVAYLTTYVEVFRTAENLTERPLFSFFSGSKESADDNEDNAEIYPKNPIISQIFLPISLISVGLGLYFTVLSSGSELSGSNLSRLGPYDVTSGATKLKVVTERIDSEKGKLDNKGRGQQRNNATDRSSNSSRKLRSKAASKKAEAEAARRKAAEAEAMKKTEEEAKKKAEEEAKKKADEEAKKKAEEEMMKRLEKEARRRAEEEANAASAAAAAKVEGML